MDDDVSPVPIPPAPVPPAPVSPAPVSQLGQRAALDTQTLKALSTPSDAKGLRHLTGHLSLLALTSALVLWSSGGFWIAPALLAQGVVLIFLFAPLHETIHRTAFRSRRLNDGVATLCGFLLLLPAGYFRAFHLQHHRFTQDPTRDPELAGPPLATRSAYLLHVSGLPYWAERLATTWRHALGRTLEPYITARLRPAIVREARLHLAGYGLIAGAGLLAGSDVLLLLWVIPALLGQPALRLYLLAEHTGCPPLRDLLANSRSTLTAAPLAALSWHMNLHTAHHAYPGLPFHALPAADRLLAPHMAVRAAGYIPVQREIWRRLTPA
ncbi:fatty acid desaturase [Pelagibius marinus]|uniref:fatty acid desaturase n=1 Tax=Pelagibius marinus TaxID=2762760 RepID=UPI0018729946|nr:fatty acid desaturase [Pelagibius marinus]